MGSAWMRTGIILLVAAAAITIALSLFRPTSATESKDLSEVIALARSGQVESIETEGDSLTVRLKDDSRTFESRKESGSSIVEVLKDNDVEVGGPDGVSVTVKEPGGFGNLIPILVGFLPLIIFGAILIFMFRRLQGFNSQAMSFGKSRARVLVGDRPTVTFTDVAGVEEAKEELQEVVEFLKYPEKFAALGARIPRGVLLVGPPGTGKTLLAKAVAGEAGVPFFSISGSEFVEMFVGVGASRVRDLFDQAKRNAPAIVFVDEIDAVARHRGAGLGGGHDEREQTLNQILVEMDGFDTGTNVIVVAATNRPDVLDPALLRPGRFDRRVVLDQPDVQGRGAILEVHFKGKPLDKHVDLRLVAKQTPGFSGADLANLANEGAILAARRNKKRIGMAEITEAVDRVMLGPERKSRVISPQEKEIAAYHEAGHGLVAHKLTDFDPVRKITIVRRGMAGGYTLALPEEEHHIQPRSYYEKLLAYALGGHAAEDLVFGQMTTGPANDIERVTNVARAMVTRWGMSERLGPRTFGRKEELVFLGKEVGEQRNYSEKVAQEIDEEVRLIIDRAYDAAKKILTDNRAKLDQIARRLIEVETVEGEELHALFDAPVDQEPTTAPEAEKRPEAPEASEERASEEDLVPTPRVPKTGLAWGSGAAVDVRPNADQPSPTTRHIAPERRR